MLTKMSKIVGVGLLINILSLIVLTRSTTAVGFNECSNNDKSDNKIRIGFLSHYKSSKVSSCWEFEAVLKFLSIVCNVHHELACFSDFMDRPRNNLQWLIENKLN